MAQKSCAPASYARIPGLSPLRQKQIYVVVLFIISILQYSYSLGNDFVWDARGAFLQDPTIRQSRFVPSYFTTPYFVRNYEADEPEGVEISTLPYYRPLVRLLHFIEYQIFDGRSTGYNLTSILLNAFVVIMAFMVVLALSGQIHLSFLASLLYAVNPSRVEAVSWSYSDSYILMALFILCAFYLYHTERRPFSWVLFAAALLSQESAVLFIVIVLLYEVLGLGKKSGTIALRIFPFAAILIAYLGIRHLVAGGIPLTHIGTIEYMNTVAVLIKRYVKVFFVPDAAVTLYQYRSGMFGTMSREVIVSYLLLAFLVSIGIGLWRTSRHLLFWYLWFFVFITVSFNVGRSADYLMAEKILYISSLGFCVIISRLVAMLQARRIVKVSLISAVLMFHFSVTYYRTLFWTDTLTYLEKGAEFAPNFYLLTYNLGLEYAKKGEYENAQRMFWKTLFLKPDLTFLVRDISAAYNERAYVLYKSGQMDGALRQLRLSLALLPEQSHVHTQIGNIYYEQGLADSALSEWKKALEISPQDTTAFYNIGMLYEKRGDLKEAASSYREYLAREQNPPSDIRQRIEHFGEQ